MTVLLDERWEWWRFIHLTDVEDVGTGPLYEDPSKPVVIDGGSLRWCPEHEGLSGVESAERPPSRVRVVLGTAADSSVVAAEGVLTLRSGEVVVSDRSVWPWRRLTVAVGRHEVRLVTRAEAGGTTYEVRLSPA